MVARNFIPCKKGGTLTVNYNMTRNTEFFRFIYAEGEPYSSSGNFGPGEIGGEIGGENPDFE